MSLKRFLHLSIAAALLAPSLAPPRAHAQAGPPLNAAPQAQAAAATAQDDTASRVAAVERAFDEARAAAGVPGAALVIVRGDQVVLLKASGVRDVAKGLPVTPDTLFAIGSCTKAFTALAAVMSQDDGKLSLDDSPKKFLPYFSLRDKEAEAQATLRDLLSHRTGLAGTEIAWYTGVLNREEVIRVAGLAKPSAKLREKFQYQNVMYSAAGEAVARAQGQTWENLISTRILKPLGMTKSVLSVREMQAAPDYSLGYQYNPATKESRQVATRDITNVAPAGAINSSAREMAQWLKFMLAGGVTPEGKRLVSEKGFAELVTPQIKINDTASYGLGWAVAKMGARTVYTHTGGIDGFGALVSLLPQEKLGVAVLANVEGTPLLSTALRAVVSNLLATPQAAGATAASDFKPESAVGRYDFAAAKMVITVSYADGKLSLDAPGQPRYTLEGVGGRRFSLVGMPGFFATFRPVKGNESETELYLEQPQGNYTLPKIKEGATAAAAAVAPPVSDALRELLGAYEMAGMGKVEVRVSDGKVVFTIPGQPDYPLVEKEKDVYTTPLMPDSYSLLARRDAAGKVSALVLRQPEGEFELKRVGDAPAATPAASPTPAATSQPSATPKPPIAAEELLAKMIAAAGGEANLRRHRSMRTTSAVTLEAQGLEGEAVTYAQAPNSFARELTFTGLGKRIGSTREFFDGAAGGEEASFTAQPSRWGEKKIAEMRVARNFYGLLDWKTNYKKVEVTGTATEGGEDAYVVVYTPERGSPATEYVSTKTFLVLRRDTSESSGAGEAAPVKARFSDYRSVEGVLVPFLVVYDVPDTGEATERVKEVKFDAPVPPEVFRAKR
ncbi:MAG TPA: serine hydrolase [Pyrinomonadaceae bacterium]|jgi:CubicO group peptidase (beta-lactamase class C family)|nr:serine hydrolase [Pyrinomonadaceae bacterium]